MTNTTANIKIEAQTQSAAAKIRQLERELDALKNKLQASWKPAARITEALVDPRVMTALKGMRKNVSDFSDDWAKRYRKMARVNALNETHWENVRGQIEAIEKSFARTGKLTDKQATALRKLLPQAGALRYVITKAYDDYEGREMRLGRLRTDMTREQLRQKARLAGADEASHRQEIRNWQYRQRLRDNTMRMQARERREMAQRIRQPLSQGMGRMRQGVNSLDNPFFNSPFFYGMMATGAAAAATRSSFKAAQDVDTAEVRMEMFGEISREQIRRHRGDWLDASGIKYGFGPARTMEVATEVLKAGIPEQFLRQTTEGAMVGAAGLDLDVAQTMKLMGRLATITQEIGAEFNPAFIDKTLNSIGVAAASLAADSDEIVAGMRRGVGALSASKMSASDLSAFVGTGISAGLQSGRAGTFTGFLVSELVNAPKARGQRAQDLRRAAGMLRMGSVQQISRGMTENPMETLQTMLSRMGDMPEARRSEVANLIGMREWRDELLVMVKSRDDLARTLKDIADKPEFLTKAIEKRVSSLRGVGLSAVAAFERVWAGIGSGFEDVFRDIALYFIDWAKAADLDAIKAHVQGMMKGLMEGLGLSSWREGLEGLFGKAGDGVNFADKMFRFFKGFAEGIKTVWNVVSTVAGAIGKAMGLDMSSAEGIGKFVGGLLALGTALHFMRPVTGILFGIAAFVTGLTNIAAGFLAAKGVAAGAGIGLGGGWAAIGGAIAASLATTGILLAGLVGIGALAVMIMNWDEIKSWWDGLAGPGSALEPGVSKRRRAAETDGRIGGKDPTKWLLNKIWEGAKDIFTGSSGDDEQKGGDGGDQLFGRHAMQDFSRSADRISDHFESMGGRLQLAALTSPGMFTGTGGGGGFSGSVPAFPGSGGGSLFAPPPAPFYGIGKRGIIGGGAGGTAPSNLLDIIRKGETGTLGPASWDTITGQYRGARPGKPISQMTIAEVKAFQKHMLRNGVTDSAVGGFQINNVTLEDFQRRMGLSDSQVFNEATQRSIANEIYKSTGGNLNRLRGRWTALRKVPDHAILGAIRSGQVTGDAGTFSGEGMAGLRIKSAESIGGGPTANQIFDVAHWLQNNTPGGVKHFAAFNDRFHQNHRKNSWHTKGMAGDATFNDPSQYAAMAEKLRAQFRAAGLSDKEFEVIDHHARRDAPPHLHWALKGQEAAAKYQAFVERQKALAAQGQGITAGAPTPQSITQGVPVTTTGGAGVGGAGASGPQIHAPITIQGSGRDPDEIAQAVQRRITEAMNYRTHDVEHELT